MNKNEWKGIEGLKVKYPHHVLLKPYLLDPRPEKVPEYFCPFGSWVDTKGERTFGFEDLDKARAFATNYGGTVL